MASDIAVEAVAPDTVAELGSQHTEVWVLTEQAQVLSIGCGNRDT